MTRHTNRRSAEAKKPSHETAADPSSGEEQAPPTPQTFSFSQKLIGACCLALVVRLLHVLQTSTVPTTVQLVGDSAGYFKWATDIAGGNWIGDTTFYQAPLYPYFLAVLIKCFGSGVMLIRVVQSLLGVASVALVGIAGRNLFNERVGLASAVMLALYPPAIYYDGIIQKAALAAVLLCGLIAACTYLQQQQLANRHRLGVSVSIGILLGLLTLTRENALLWTPILPAWIVLGITSIPVKSRFALAACYAGGLAAILLPVAARNSHFGGEWSPTTFQAGPNFYIGNNLNANGVYHPLVPGHETPEFERADAQRLAEQATGRELTVREVSQFWMDLAFEDIGQDRSRWLQLMFVKTLMVVNRYEVPDVESLYVYREFSKPIQLGWLWHFGILCPLAVMGMVHTWGDRRRLWLYYALILSMIAAVGFFFILGRYRFPLVPLLVPFAAAGLFGLWEHRREPRRAIAPILAAVGFAIICNLPVHDERSLNASSFMNLGVSAGKAGDMAGCMRWLDRAIELQPDMAEAHFNLGLAWSRRGRPDLAARSFLRAGQLDPLLVGVDYHVARSLEEAGDPKAAMTFYRRAIEVNPDDIPARLAIDRLGSGP